MPQSATVWRLQQPTVGRLLHLPWKSWNLESWMDGCRQLLCYGGEELNDNYISHYSSSM